MSVRNKWLWGVGIIAAAAAALAYGVPVQYVLIAGVLLLCPAMMFMHGKDTDDGSGKDGHGASQDNQRDRQGKEQ